jgi:import receptor subunit TOM70
MRHQPSLNADDLQDRKDYAAKLKAAGNKAYGSKDYNRAIDLYGKAILCKQDPVFYSNRAACYNAMSEWDKVIEDTTAAINLDNEYVKALNRRANAYEQVERNSEALLDYTASCIIDGFRNESSAQSVERLLKKVADAKGKAILASKEKKLPSPTFVTNYLQSFRPKPTPEGLEDDAELDEESGKGQLRKGLKAMATSTAQSSLEISESTRHSRITCAEPSATSRATTRTRSRTWTRASSFSPH